MPSLWQSITNRKLHSARLQLNAWEACEDYQIEAYRDAFLLHGRLAYSSVIAELMTAYGTTPAKLPTLEDALSALATKDQNSLELTRLQELENSDSWLAHLLSAFDEVMTQEALPVSHSTSGKIMTTTISPETGDMTQGVGTVVAGAFILSSLKELTLHFRNFNLEW